MNRCDTAIWVCDILSGITMLSGGGQSSSAPQQTTTTSSPWAPQQPYLTEGFQGAQNLYEGGGPGYYPSDTYVGYNPTETGAINQVPGVANSNINGIDTSASGFENNLLTGGYLSGNPAISGFENFGSSTPATDLGYFAGNNVGVGTPGSGTLNNIAGTNYGSVGSNLGSDELFGLGGTNMGYSNPGTGTLSAYSSGAYGSNPNTNALSQSVMSQVVPGIESQFIAGGDLSSPEAAYSTAAGATSALAPSLFQNYQTQEGLQEGAAQNLSSNYLQGGAIQSAIANELAQNTLGGASLSSGAAGTLGNESLTGSGISENAAGTLGNENLTATSGLGQNYDNAITQMLQGTAFAPTVQNMPYTDLSNEFGAGSAEQTNAQNQTNADINQWNYYQTLPYQMLNQYEGQVTGNYGGTVTEPYFGTSNSSNAIGGALSGASAGAGIGSALFGAGSGGAVGGAGLGALAGLMFL